MAFLDHLHQRKLEPGEKYYDTGEESMCTVAMRYEWARKKNKIFELLPGAINNGASIPSIIPDFILNDHGKIDKPAAVHDDIYWAYRDATKAEREAWEAIHGIWTKEDADLQFYDGCRDENMWQWRCATVYAGVRLNLIADKRWGTNV